MFVPPENNERESVSCLFVQLLVVFWHSLTLLCHFPEILQEHCVNSAFIITRCSLSVHVSETTFPLFIGAPVILDQGHTDNVNLISSSMFIFRNSITFCGVGFKTSQHMNFDMIQPITPKLSVSSCRKQRRGNTLQRNYNVGSWSSIRVCREVKMDVKKK